MMIAADTAKDFVESHLAAMDGPEKVYALFSGLGYKTLDTTYKGKEAWQPREKYKDAIREIYAVANYDRQFQILLVELNSKNTQIIRDLSHDMAKEIEFPMIIFTQDYKEYTFTLLEKIRVAPGVWKKPKLIRLNFDRTYPYHTDKLAVSNMALNATAPKPVEIYKKILEAMSVEKVSRMFFKDYKGIFFDLRKRVEIQGTPVKQAHEFTQQFLNRIMFIYFIDKKGWLEHSPRFMKWFWERYQEEAKKTEQKESFFKEWLMVLFLYAFNNNCYFNIPYLPKDVHNTLKDAPYLNGGLFKENELDRLPINLPDEVIAHVLKDFFEKYNFTIREDLPLEVEVAVDPEMLGYVYESLSNVAEEIYERQDLGIFYTPKIEVDFMCRRSLLEYLSKSTDLPRTDLYHLLFDSGQEREKVIQNHDICEKLESALEDLTAADPACGSGAFLVGMLNVLEEIHKLLKPKLNRTLTDFEIKKRIIGNSLYGVDVMPWAVHSAELRLWLSLMIESDLKPAELKLSPLLPNLNLKLRVGDSLVQEIGGISLNVRDSDISPTIKRSLTNLRKEKEKYFNADRTAKFKSDKEFFEEEARIFHQILEDRISRLKSQGIEEKFSDAGISQKDKTEKLKKKQEELEKLEALKGHIKANKPFVWDIDFAEIFGEKGGFDIVIGNPPYIRQEKIAPPNRLRSEVTLEDKKEYKEKLLRSVQAHLPLVKSIEKKSDYYIYFYFHGLSLLNPNGTFCFITSNSWLDVGYGKDLQEFLLKYVPVIAIYDNQAKRSFEHAEINTIIALFGAPIRKKETPAFNNIAKFIMFKKPFEETINADNLLKIESAEEVLSTDDFRVFPKTQKDLLEEGWEYPDDIGEEQKKTFTLLKGKYTGNKWGGKYLRAPDIFFKILEKGKDKLVRLGDIADVRRGFTTGANDFFYVRVLKVKDGIAHIRCDDGSEHTIEAEYVKEPVIVKAKELLFSASWPNGLAYRLVKLDKEASKKPHARAYIAWGESKKFNLRPTTRSRPIWHVLDPREPSHVIVPIGHKRRPSVCLSKGILADNNLVEVTLNQPKCAKPAAGSLFTVFTMIVCELTGRANFGQGLLKTQTYEIARLSVLNPAKVESQQVRKLEEAFARLALRPPLMIYDEARKPDRHNLDETFLECLGFENQPERNIILAELYDTACRMIWDRMAKSASARESHQTYYDWLKTGQPFGEVAEEEE
jgi:hypothetical protein